MFDGPYERRLQAWHDFRNTLETASNPLQATIDFYRMVPRISINTDPYDDETWPDPWEMILENTYCEFCILLGICYTLQLTTRFSEDDFEINIVQDREKSQTKYLLFVNEWCLGYDDNSPVLRKDLPKSLTVEKSYVMPSLQ